jgi:serine/threonine protein kinase
MPGYVRLEDNDPREIGRYRLIGRVAEGGQGVVYLGESPTGERVAVKVLRTTWLADPGARSRLVKEVAAARQVAPFCTAQVIEAQLDGDIPFIASEYVEGPSLAEFVRTRGPLTGAALDRLAISTATALVAIHQAQVVHRDFKPANVVLGPDGPRVVDFGIARNLNLETTVIDHVFGTPAYMAPEQISGSKVGPATDLFGWASTLVFAATGHSPYDEPDVGALMHRVLHEEPDLSGVPASLVGAVKRCLAKDPGQRPTAQQVLLTLLGDPEHAGESDTVDLKATLILAAQLAATGTIPTQIVPPDPHRPAPNRSGDHPTMAEPGLPVAQAHFAGPPPDHQPDQAALAPRPRRKLQAVLLTVVLILVLVIGLQTLARLTSRPSAQAQPPAGAVVPPAKLRPPVHRSARAKPTPSALPSSRPVAPSNTIPSASSEPSSPSTSADSPLTAPTIPQAFNGTWRGLAVAPNATPTTYQVTILLKTGETLGVIRLPGLKCSGLLKVSKPEPTDTTMNLYLGSMKGPPGGCPQQTGVVVALIGTRTMTVTFKDATQESATGTLARI